MLEALESVGKPGNEFPAEGNEISVEGSHLLEALEFVGKYGNECSVDGLRSQVALDSFGKSGNEFSVEDAQAAGTSVPSVSFSAASHLGSSGVLTSQVHGAVQVRASLHTTMQAGAVREAAVEAARAALSVALSGALPAGRPDVEVVIQVFGICRRPSRFWIDVVCESPSGAVIESGGSPMTLPRFAEKKDEAQCEAVSELFRDAAVAFARAVVKQATRRGPAEHWHCAQAKKKC